MQKNEMKPPSHNLYIDWKWVNDLTIRAKSIKPLQENVRVTTVKPELEWSRLCWGQNGVGQNRHSQEK